MPTGQQAQKRFPIPKVRKGITKEARGSFRIRSIEMPCLSGNLGAIPTPCYSHGKIP